MVVVTGMRQVGKTTLIQSQAIAQNRSYISLDDFAFLQAARHAPESLLDRASAVTLDEVQKAPELLPVIKSIVDKSRTPGQFLLSGSANLLLLQNVSESLAGRSLYLDLWPLSRRESKRTQAKPFLIDFLQTGRLDLNREWTPLDGDDVILGGMPQIVLNDSELEMWFLGFEQTYLNRDVRGLSQVGDLAQFQRFLHLTALRTGNLVHISELARDAAVSVATASRWLGVLEASFSAYRLPPYMGNRTSRIVKSPKLFMSDSGIANHLIGPRAKAMSGDDHFAGQLLETYVAQNLRSMVACFEPLARVFFWNVQGRYEVDFVVELGQRTVAIEIKRGSRWSAADLRGLRRFLDLSPNCEAALLACNIEAPTQLDDKLYAIPIGLLLS